MYSWPPIAGASCKTAQVRCCAHNCAAVVCCVCRDPAKGSLPNVALMQRIPPASSIVAYWDFVFKTSIAATMFPHLCQRLFAARNEAVMRRSMSMMNFRWGCRLLWHGLRHLVGLLYCIV